MNSIVMIIVNVINVTDAFLGGQNLEPTSLTIHAIKKVKKNKEKNIFWR